MGIGEQCSTILNPIKKLYTKVYSFFIGAGSGNRTHVASLEGWGSTIELHLHFPLTVYNYNVSLTRCQYFFKKFLKIFEKICFEKLDKN